MRQVNRRTFLKGVGILGGTALGIGAFSPFETQAQGKVLRYGIGALDVKTLDPMGGPIAPGKTILTHIYQGLVRWKPGEVNVEAIEPDLAESWEVSKDKRSWTFHLRKGVEFHKGFGEFTSDDVVFWLNRAKNKKTNVYHKSYGPFRDIQAMDKYTVRIHLAKPMGAVSVLPAFVGWQAGMVMSKKAAEKLGDKIKTNPVGTGPFVFKEHIPKERIVLVRNENYFRGMPKIEQIVFRFLPDTSSRTLAFKAGELDIMELDREQRAIDQVKGPGVVIEGFGPGTVMMVFMDRTRKPLNDIRVRQAIAYAIKRDDFIKFVGADVGRPIYSVTPSWIVGGLQDVPERLKYAYNPQKAKKLLAEAGLPNGFTLGPVYISEIRYLRAPMEIIQEQLRRVGIKLDLNVIAHPAWHKKNDEGSNPFFIRANTRFPVASFILEEFFTVGAKRNFSKFSGADADIKGAREELDIQVQKKLWGKAQIKILEDLAAYPVYTWGSYYARKSNVQLGFKLDSELCICVPIKWNAQLR